MDKINLDITFTPEDKEDYKNQIIEYIESYPKNNKNKFQWKAIEKNFNEIGINSMTGNKWNNNSIRNFYNKNKIKGEKAMGDVKEEEVKAEKKVNKKETKQDKKEVKTDKKEVKRKAIKKMSKSDMVKIIDTLNETPMTANLLKGKFKVSLVSAHKIKNILTNTQWKKVNEDTPLPQGYMVPKNLEQTIMAVMFDRGFFTE